MLTLKNIIEIFSKGKSPKGAEFEETWKSFWHKSEKAPMEQIVGLNDALSNKASYQDLEDTASKLKVKYYGTEAELNADQPNPKIGDKAWVGLPYPGTVWICQKNGEWKDTTKAPTQEEVDLASYAKINDFGIALSQNNFIVHNKSYGRRRDNTTRDRIEVEPYVTLMCIEVIVNDSFNSLQVHNSTNNFQEFYFASCTDENNKIVKEYNVSGIFTIEKSDLPNTVKKIFVTFFIAEIKKGTAYFTVNDVAYSPQAGVSRQTNKKYSYAMPSLSVLFPKNVVTLLEPVQGIYKENQPIGEPPAYAGAGLSTYTHTYISDNPSNHLARNIYCYNVKGANNPYRSVLIVDESGNEIFKTNRSGDMCFQLYHGYTIQVTVDQTTGAVAYGSATPLSLSKKIDEIEQGINNNTTKIEQKADFDNVALLLGDFKVYDGKYARRMPTTTRDSIQLGSHDNHMCIEIPVNDTFENVHFVGVNRNYQEYYYCSCTDENNKIIKEFNTHSSYTVAKSDLPNTVKKIFISYLKPTIKSGSGYFTINDIPYSPQAAYHTQSGGGTSSSIQGLTFWSIFDSLGQNSWQILFAQLTGAEFNKELNVLPNKPISQGGTPTSANMANGTLGRAKNLVSYKGQYPIDVVFIENVNDMQYVDNNANINGSISDEAWMMGEKMVGYVGNFTSRQEAQDYANANLASILNDMSANKRKKGAILSFPYTNSNQNGYKIKINSKATSSGNASVVKDGQKYSFAVTPQMSEQDIIDCIVQYSYGSGWNVIDNGDNSATIYYYTDTSSVITFDDGGTGIQSEVTKTGSAGEYCKFFTGYATSEWTDTSKWVESISLWSMYKGLVEYLKTNLPTALLYWFIPTYYSVDFNDSSIKNPDGSYSMSKYRNTAIFKRWQSLKACQVAVCDYYKIPYVDVDTLSNINLFNLSVYYNSSNVHPKQDGYDRWSYVLSKEF